MLKRRHEEFGGRAYASAERPSRARMPSAPASSRRSVGSASAASRSLSPYATGMSDRSRPGSGRSSVGEFARAASLAWLARNGCILLLAWHCVLLLLCCCSRAKRRSLVLMQCVIRAVSDSSSRATSRRPRSTRSAPSGEAPRFDPTEYVRAQRAKAAAAARRSRSTIPPASSRPAGPAAVPPRVPLGTRQRSSSAGPQPRVARQTVASPLHERRPTSLSRERAPHIVRPSRSVSGPRHGSSSRERSTSRASKASGVSREHARHNAWAPEPTEGQHGLHDGRDTVRAASPGRALQQVKEKLAAYKLSTGVGTGDDTAWANGHKDLVANERERAPAHRPEWQPPRERDRPLESRRGAGDGSDRRRHKAYDDASTDIADIDNRLQALQDFLRTAKASSAQPS
jgi:hypothetical protein